MAHGIPVVIGEYGLLGFDKSLEVIEHGEIIKFFDYPVYYAERKGLTLMLWDNGQHFDRRLFKWADIDIYNVINYGILKKIRSSYTENDFIYIKKGSKIDDVRLKMYSNGNVLINIKGKSRNLEVGVDYDIDGEMLIIKSNFIEDAISNVYGINDILTCQVSGDPDWKIKIILYDTPLLKESKGTVDDFYIPIEFNGDSVATMEAFYEDGRNAGPKDWTSFKEYGHSFVPLYESNIIKIPKEFFNDVKDGKVILKIHFWSGSIVTYLLEKQESDVFGIPQ